MKERNKGMKESMRAEGGERMGERMIGRREELFFFSLSALAFVSPLFTSS